MAGLLLTSNSLVVFHMRKIVTYIDKVEII
jgi:hypothetical protein